MTTSMNLSTYMLFAFVLIQTVFGAKNVIYWGQESQKKEKPLADYCDGTYDIIVIGFVYEFPTPSSRPNSKYPALNFASHCETSYSDDEPYLLICPQIGTNITYCQSRGVQIYISIGGGVGRYGFTSDSQGQTFATLMWNMFMGGSDPNVIRPFGNATIDGIDLDIEGGDNTGYVAFIRQLRQYYTASPRNYFISSAPQCFYPDRIGPGPGTTLSNAWFDYVWIQFYNNHCGVHAYGTSAFNFDKWAAWARTGSVNPNVKLLIGAPASPFASGNGYITLAALQTLHNDMTILYGDIYAGLMLWDISNSDLNNNYGGSVAAFLHGAASPVPVVPVPAQPVTTGVPTPVTTGVPTPVTTGVPTPVTTGVPTPVTTGARPVQTTGMNTPVTTGINRPATTGMNTPITTGMNTPVTTGMNRPATTGMNAPITTGLRSTGVLNNMPGAGATQPSNDKCTDRYMKCLSDNTFSTCNFGKWGVSQSCGAGLRCSPTGNYIYCV